MSIYPVAAPCWAGEGTRQLPVTLKRAVVGRKGGVVLAGGSVADLGGQSQKPRAPTDVEPVFYHSLPVAIDDDWMHSYDLVGSVSCAAGPGHDALVCTLNRKSYFGLTLSEENTRQLNKFPEMMVWKVMLIDCF